eukprot:GHVP01056095.1.p3 GENE.GHVP01056095.1~~GHVP01056095.1.p3  ORF type:complete len:299 (-),score=54.67 GHVP01056095.1:2686-3582(-)
MDSVNSAVNFIAKHHPPQEFQQTAQCLETILEPKVSSELKRRVEGPIFVVFDKTVEKYFVCGDYNRVSGKHYRSPWSGLTFDDKGEKHETENRNLDMHENLRQFEIITNEMFENFCQLRYKCAVSSVYFWGSPSGFQGAFLVRKKSSPLESILSTWEVIHAVQVQALKLQVVEAKVSSTLRWHGLEETSTAGTLDAGIFISRDSGSTPTKLATGALKSQGLLNDEDTLLSPTLLHDLGSLIEVMDTKLHKDMETPHFGRCKCALSALRGLRQEEESEVMAEFSSRINAAKNDTVLLQK